MKRGPDQQHRIAWGVMALAMVVLSSLSVSVPKAFAQSQDQKSLEMRKYFQTLESAFQFIAQNYVDEVDSKKLYEGAMKGMLDALGDPYSLFLDEKTWNYLNDTTIVGEFGGIGASIAKQAIPASAPPDTPSFVEVFSVFDGSPSWKAGIMPGDLILKVNGESTAPLLIDEATKKIRGEPGTKVTLLIRRGSSDFELTVTRAKVEIPTVKSGLIPTASGNVAYLRILEFSPQTYGRVKDAIKTFDAAGYRAMVLDLRSNPGGLLNSAVQIADLFLDSGVIVSTKGRSPYENEVSKARADVSVAKDKPLVVLINKGSASAAEILSGALKDNRRAILVGENSYGKGSVQQIIPVDDTGFKLTMARYYTPSDENIDKTGIPPDIESKDLTLNEAESLALQKLGESGKVEAWGKEHPQATVAERNGYAADLAAAYPPLQESLVRRLLRDELIRKNQVQPAFDLEFDTMLADALKTVDAPDFAARLAQVRTVKELVEAKKASLPAATAGSAAAPATK